MEGKKLILAIILSIVVIALYQFFFVPKQPKIQPKSKVVKTSDQTIPEKKEDKRSDETTSTQDISELFSSKKKDVVVQRKYKSVEEDLKENELKDDITIKTDLFTAVFTNKGAGLKSFVLRGYNDDIKQPLDLISKKVEKYKVYPFYFSPFEDNDIYENLNKKLFQFNIVDRKNGKEIIFKYADRAQNLSVFKKFIFSNNSFVIGLEYELIKDGKSINVPFVFGPDLENNVSKLRTMQQALKIGAYDGNDIKKAEFRKIKTIPKQGTAIETARNNLDGFFYWAAYETTYFAAIFKTDNKNASIRYSIIREKIRSEKGFKFEHYSYMVVENPTCVYMGPKDEEILGSIRDIYHNINKVIQYGWFGSIAKIMQKGISIAHKIFPNYGWAIILFTLFLKILLFPLTYASSVSMAKMQALQPKIKAIKKKFKNVKDPDQRRQMNMETMALYKKEKVNPAGGCLPMLLQLPILWGLFRFLAVSINVRHEPWIFWIKDLSLKDPIYVIPILMGITQLVLQKMSPTSGDSAQNKMMYIMPVVITFFVMSLPCGLTLYWFVSNLLQLVQQHFINKKIFQKKKDEEKKNKIQKRKKGAKNK